MTNQAAQTMPEPVTASMCLSSDYAKGWNDCLAALSQTAGVPDVLFDGYAAYQGMTDEARARINAGGVSDVLDSVVRLIRAQAAPAASGVHPDALQDGTRSKSTAKRVEALRMAQGECRHSLWSPAGGYCLDCGYSPVGPDEESAIDAAVGLAKVVLRLPVELLGEIDHRAQQSGCVRNAYLRQLLAEHHTQPPHQDRGEVNLDQVDAALFCTPVTDDGDELAMPIDCMNMGTPEQLPLARTIMRAALTAALTEAKQQDTDWRAFPYSNAWCDGLAACLRECGEHEAARQIDDIKRFVSDAVEAKQQGPGEVLARGWFHALPEDDYEFHDDASGAGKHCPGCIRAMIVREAPKVEAKRQTGENNG